MDLEHLRISLQQVMSDLEGVTWKKMFGCDAAFRDGTIFALVWKEGRIGLKYLDDDEFEVRISHQGSNRWEPGGRTTKYWVLIPTEIVENKSELKQWTEKSYASVGT
jgi:TfoX/Sxy family transcriptional regulator of competence genes